MDFLCPQADSLCSCLSVIILFLLTEIYKPPPPEGDWILMRQHEEAELPDETLFNM